MSGCSRREGEREKTHNTGSILNPNSSGSNAIKTSGSGIKSASCTTSGLPSTAQDERRYHIGLGTPAAGAWSFHRAYPQFPALTARSRADFEEPQRVGSPNSNRPTVPLQRELESPYCVRT